MKNVLMIALLAAFTAAGFLKSRALSVRVSEIEGLLSFVRGISLEISSFRRPLDTVIPILLSKINCKWTRDYAAAQDWHSLSLPYLNSDEKDVMDEFFDNLGAGESENQISLCKITETRLVSIQNSAKEICKSKAPLYKSMGFLIGALSVIVLI